MMFRWDVVAKAHEFVAKINKLTPEKVRHEERSLNTGFLTTRNDGLTGKRSLFEILGPICLGVKSCVQV